MARSFDIYHLDNIKLAKEQRLQVHARNIRGDRESDPDIPRPSAVLFALGVIARTGLFAHKLTVEVSPQVGSVAAQIFAAVAAANREEAPYADVTYRAVYARRTGPGDLVVDRLTGQTYLLREDGLVEASAGLVRAIGSGSAEPTSPAPTAA